MPVLNTISSDKLVRLVGIPSGPVVIDVRPEDEFATEPLLIPGTLRRAAADIGIRSEEHTSELQSLMRISYAFFRLIDINLHCLSSFIFYFCSYFTYFLFFFYFF